MVLLYTDVDERAEHLAEPGDDAPEDIDGLLSSIYSEIDGLTEADRRAAVERQILTMGRILKSLKANLTMLEGHKLDVDARIDGTKSHIDRLRSWTQNLLAQEGIDKVKDPLVTVYLSGQAASWQVDDQDAVPEPYQTAHIRLPLDVALEKGLGDYIDHADVSKTVVEANFKETGEVPAGMTRVSDRKHLVVR